MEQGWKIEVIDKDAVGSDRGALVLEWTLNQTPDPEWTQFLVHSSVQKSGSATFVFSEPVVSANKVHIHLEDRDVEAAASYIEKSVSYANDRYESQVLARRNREAAQKQDREAAEAARLDQARNRLRATGSSGAE